MQLETWCGSDNKIKHRISGSLQEILCWSIFLTVFSMATGIFLGSIAG